MRISDWSSDVCSSDLEGRQPSAIAPSSVLRAATSPWLRHREDQAGLRCLRLHANVAAMLKRFLPLAALVTFTLPSLVTAQGVTPSADPRDRKSVVSGKSVSVRVVLGGGGKIKKKKK